MGLHRYKAWNGPMPTTAAQAAVATGTSIKTMLQIAPPATRAIRVISWGFSLTDLPNADSVVELLQTNVAATVTAHVAAGVQPVDPGLVASLVTLGTTSTGYTSSGEGAITATRVFDLKTFGSAAGTGDSLHFCREFLPDEQPVVAASTFLRVRATFGQDVGMRTWVCWEE